MSGWRAELNRPNVGLVLALAGVETATVGALYALAGGAPPWVTATLAAVAAAEYVAGVRLMR